MADAMLLNHGDERGSSSLTISCHDLSYCVKVKPSPCGKEEEKQILHDITGVFSRGMNAIMGPTGSGKTSLLDILADRKDPRGVRGTVLVDGHKQPENFKCMTGYVVQDDVVMGTLSVRENIAFSANLRLPGGLTQEEKERRVDDIIAELGLNLCANTKLGNEFIRGVSGGERKRTNIGMELIIGSPVLFLDEPTTGLDASTASSIMDLLHRLSENGKTIIFSIHQPRYSIYKLFDHMVLLSLGRTVYQGSNQDVLQYFQEIGHVCEPFNNPADFLLDVINGTVRSSGEKCVVATLSEGNYEVKVDDVESTTCKDLSEKYAQSHRFKDMKKAADVIMAHFTQAETQTATCGQYSTSFCTQLKYVGKRTITNLCRNPQTSFVQLIVTTVFALIVGLIFLRIDKDVLPAAIQNRVGAMFFIIMNQVFANLSAIELFIKERRLFIHETSNGFYRVSAYFLSMILCDIIPMRAVPIIIFSCISYFMIGFQRDAARFFFYLLDLFLTSITATSIGIFMGASFRVHAIANLMAALVFVFMMVFSGLLVNLMTMSPWMNWIQYLSLFRYSLNAVSISELSDLELCSEIATENSTVLICDTTAANAYLDTQGIKHETAWDLWSNELALGLMFIGVMCSTWLRLIFVNKHK